MVGKELPGTIERIDCKAYEFVNPESGEKEQMCFVVFTINLWIHIDDLFF